MKSKMLLLVLAVLLASCQPALTPTQEIQEVTRIVEQTVKVTQIVEQTVEIPKIVQETVIIKKLVPPQTLTSRPPGEEESCYHLQPYYFDAMIALVQHYTYLKTHQCEDYINSLTEEQREKVGDDRLNECENRYKNVTIKSIYPYNFLNEKNYGTKISDVDDMVIFVVSIDSQLKNDYVYHSSFMIRVINENGEWKIGSGGTMLN